MSSNHPSDNALIFSHLVAYNLIGYAVYIQTEQNLSKYQAGAAETKKTTTVSSI